MNVEAVFIFSFWWLRDLFEFPVEVLTDFVSEGARARDPTSFFTISLPAHSPISNAALSSALSGHNDDE
jgi:hypothetical protein